MKEFNQLSIKKNDGSLGALISVILLAGATSASSPVYAQSEERSEGLVLEEVLVTATKRETTLMNTGISVSAFSAEKLSELGIENFDDLSVNTPGLTISSSERITIRGVGIDSLALGIDPAVASYIDGYYTRGIGPYTVNNFFDVQRIEVLRGPQGTLYGRNTAGGAINIISNKPIDMFEGEVNLEVGSEGYTVAQGMLNVPLGEKFAWRMSASQINRDGLQQNDAGPDVDELDDTTLDTTLRANWTESWYTDVRYFGHRRGGRPSSRYQVQPYITDTRVFPGAITINHTWAWDQDNPAVQDPSKTSLDHANTLDEDFDLIMLTNVFTVGDVDIKYIGGYSDFLRESSTDSDWSSSTRSSSVNNIISDSEQMTHELQFISNFDGKANFIAGLFYFDSDERLYFDFQNDIDPIYSTSLNWDTEFVTLGLASPTYGPRFPLVTLPGALMSEFVLGGFRFPDFRGDPENRVFWFDTELESNSYAGYGQLDYNFTDDLMLTVGARYSKDEKEGKEIVSAMVPMSEDFGAIPIGDINGDGAMDYGVIESETHKAIGNSIAYMLNSGDIAQDEKDWDNLSGLVRLEYTLDSGAFLYGSISTGYRSGGFNLGTTEPGVDSFDEETLTSYEIGYKGAALEDRLVMEFAGYFYDYSDLQVRQSFLDPDTGAQGTEFTNAAEAEVKGFEAQFTWLLSERFRVSGSYAYNNAEYTDFITIDRATIDQQVLDLSGNKLNRAPENKLGLQASYWLPLGDNGSLTFTGIYTWVDEMYTDPKNTVNGMLDSWGRGDLRASWLSPSNAMTITAFVKNVSDDRYATDASGGTIADGFLRTEYLTAPRLYGLAFNYRF